MVTHRLHKTRNTASDTTHNPPLGSSEADSRNISFTIPLWRAVNLSSLTSSWLVANGFNSLALRPSAWHLCSILQPCILAASLPGERLQLNIAMSSWAISNFLPFQTEIIFPRDISFSVTYYRRSLTPTPRASFRFHDEFDRYTSPQIRQRFSKQYCDQLTGKSEGTGSKTKIVWQKIVSHAEVLRARPTFLPTKGRNARRAPWEAIENAVRKCMHGESK